MPNSTINSDTTRPQLDLNLTRVGAEVRASCVLIWTPDMTSYKNWRWMRRGLCLYTVQTMDTPMGREE